MWTTIKESWSFFALSTFNNQKINFVSRITEVEVVNPTQPKYCNEHEFFLSIFLTMAWITIKMLEFE